MAEQAQAEDRKLIDASLRGDYGSFTKLVRKHEDIVYRFAFKVCRNHDQAEETLQDTFVNVFKKLNQFDGKSKFSTWLYSIVTNNCLMKKRRRKLDLASVSLDEFEEPVTPVREWKKNPFEEVIQDELRSLLDEAILKLPMDYRVVFILRDVEGLSAEETSKILGLSIPAVKSRLRRSRVFLREHLNEYMGS